MSCEPWNSRFLKSRWPGMIPSLFEHGFLDECFVTETMDREGRAAEIFVLPICAKLEMTGDIYLSLASCCAE